MPHFWHLETDWTWVRRFETRIWGVRSQERPGLAQSERERGSNVKFRRNGLLPTPTGQVSQIPELELRLPLNKTYPLSTCQTVQRLSPEIFFLSRIKNNFIKIIKIKVFFHGNHYPVIALSSRCLRRSWAVLGLKGQTQKPGQGRNEVFEVWMRES